MAGDKHRILENGSKFFVPAFRHCFPFEWTSEFRRRAEAIVPSAERCDADGAAKNCPTGESVAAHVETSGVCADFCKACLAMKNWVARRPGSSSSFEVVATIQFGESRWPRPPDDSAWDRLSGTSPQRDAARRRSGEILFGARGLIYQDEGRTR
ncbi:hypothetical protein [Bradyrhizobium sp.]|uniref:hypothetical protein n=1 Tax=Bradyrhizobium sp. TaxID=376 RepID=UPI0025C595A0|nr:hypothetical protein [Bradyrhizobium sp.]MBV8920166.1 hypothetical protein [Bradyrhizobium sp.]